MERIGWETQLTHKNNTTLTSLFNHNTLNFTSNDQNIRNNQLFQDMDFPVDLSRRGENDQDGNKTVTGEVDFFSNHKAVNREHDDDHHHTADPRPELLDTGLHLLTTNTGSDQSTVDDGASSDAEDKRGRNEMAVLQAKLERLNTENQKLKNKLSQVSHDYHNLQLHFVTIMQQQLQKGSENTQQSEAGQNILPGQFLNLGPKAKIETNEMMSQTFSEDERAIDRSGLPQNMEVASRINNKNINMAYDNGKGAREDSSEDSDTQAWAPNNVPKFNPPKGNSPINQSATEATMRKARVSVRARSEAPMISDGCQWRKYGQKMAKGNPCPRAYYRCTMAVGCPVRKQVQRCAEDKSILITTYEGNHNHPLPPAAMAMASTTSAAASMLLSGSMPGGDGFMNPNFLARTMLPCSTSMATISASAPFPTVTLDLTHSPNPLQIQKPSATQSAVLFPQQNGQLPPNFLIAMPQLFGQTSCNNNNNQSKFSGLQTSNPSPIQLPNQNTMFNDQTDLSAATAAITSDPNFTAALAAAISSFIGGAQPAENGAGAATSNNAPGNSTSGATTSGNNSQANNVTPGS